MAWFARFRRRRRIKRMLARLPAILRRDYGQRPPYTPKQVEASLRRHGFGERDLMHAWVLWCDLASLQATGATPASSEEIEHARREVADAAFNGDMSLGIEDVQVGSVDGAFEGGSPIDETWTHGM